MAVKEDVQENIREPLMPIENILDREDGGAGDQANNKKVNPCMVYFSTLIAVCGSYAFGSCAGYSSPTQSAIREDIALSLAEYSVFGSILTFGAMIGAITSGPIADYIGRKGAMRVSSVFCVAGWLAIYFAEVHIFLSSINIFLLATGYGMGVFSYVVPVFIAEIAPKNLRGALTTANQVRIIPCAILFLGLFFIPESPRWLAKTGKEKEFEAALQKLRGKDADITHEAAEIQDYIETLERLPKAGMLDLFQRRYLRSVTIGVGLMVFQQFGGINGICFYTSTIFESAGFSSSVGTIIYAILQVVVTGLNTIVIDRAGRKPLLLVSATGLVLGCLLVGVSFFLKDHELGLESVPALAVTGILLYIAAFSAGMGAVPWVVMSEIFPINIKGVGGSLATLVNWFGAWLVSYTFNFLMTWSSYGTFILYAAINALGILFMIIVVPETKGRTLEQIQAAINA
ncbi:Sugar transporter ERD6-like 7 [Citrus sinensis]|uniref:Sugar transporter ERD6-like 7 n=1 Tax=Citrus sinensis TaxID=2711 RepID=A0ACB8MLP2_CITSI|nr:Sugar transporter ERD6-like 7 [Citrus sinensis]